MSPNREQKVAIGLSLLAIIYMVGAWRLPRFALGTTVVDSYVFPLIIGAFLLAMSVIYFFVAGRSPKSADKPFWEGVDVKVVVKLVAVSVVYALTLGFLGFIIATTLFLAVAMWMLGTRGWLKLALTPIVFSFAVYSLFVFFLDVPLAQGLMPF
ncbi:MAG: tripartite tricarboxylate transporter TctB family protein [Mycobacterium leprae]